MTDQPKKKLPFKATALRKSSESTTGSKPPEDDDSLGLFDRRKEMLPIIAAEQQRRAKKKEKERADARQKTTSNKESTVDLVGDGKRPREESECESQMEPGDSFPFVVPVLGWQRMLKSSQRDPDAAFETVPGGKCTN